MVGANFSWTAATRKVEDGFGQLREVMSGTLCEPLAGAQRPRPTHAAEAAKCKKRHPSRERNATEGNGRHLGRAGLLKQVPHLETLGLEVFCVVPVRG